MSETRRSPAEERVLVLAPTAGGGTLLAEAGLASHPCADLAALCRELRAGAGALLLGEEALAGDGPSALADVLGAQPAWSELPILLLADRGADSPVASAAMERLGNVAVLERPVRAATLRSHVRAALRARRRQYELRDRLEALEQAEGRFARFMQQLPGLAWIKDLEGRYVYANDAAEKAFRTPRGELYGRTDDEVFAPETAAEYRANDQRALASETGIQTIESLEHGDGIVHHSIVSKFPIPGGDGRPALIGGMAVDLTEQRQAERALRESEERFRFLAETLPSMVWTASPDGTITYANQRWLQYCGLSAEENAGHWPELVLHPDDRERCLVLWTEALREGKDYEIEVRNRRHDGVYRWFVTRAVPLRDAQGRVLSWFGVTTDIHDQKEMQERLREADRRKDEFLATLAHELRNPLSPLRNSLDILQLRGEGGSEVVEVMERQLQHLVRLVDDLLEVSRITRGKIELRRERVSLADVVRTAVETSGPLIEAARHQLAVSLPSEPLTVEADPVRLGQVITNLLNNAAKYTGEGGQITLGVRREGSSAVVSVRDTGVGVPADMLPKVFEMFTQVDRSLGRAQGGLGIGLALTKRLVEMHGGSVEARSDGPGRGSEFIVRLPTESTACEVAGDRALPRDHARPQASAPRRILVVDDNVDSAQSLATLLRLMGHEVELAYEGRGVLETARGYRPEVVLLDIGLPGIDGYQVAEQLRQEPGLDRLLLIALTGYGQGEDRRRSYEAGFDEHLVKPVALASLEALLSAPRPAPQR